MVGGGCTDLILPYICWCGCPRWIFVRSRWSGRRFMFEPCGKVPITSCIDLSSQIFTTASSIRYDPKESKWTKVASMMTRRLGVAVAVLSGYLYAIGGSDGQCPLNSVERYDPQKNTWTAMAPMSTRRKHLGCAVYNNMIYAVGGRDDCTELSSAERYNPATNTWSPIVAMMSRRSGVSILTRSYCTRVCQYVHVLVSGWLGSGQWTAVCGRWL